MSTGRGSTVIKWKRSAIFLTYGSWSGASNWDMALQMISGLSGRGVAALGQWWKVIEKMRLATRRSMKCLNRNKVVWAAEIDW